MKWHHFEGDPYEQLRLLCGMREGERKQADFPL